MMEAKLVFNRIAIDEVIWNESHVCPLRIISDENFSPDHFANH